MRQDQLQQARQARWRQDGNALATLDDAERWLAETPLCLYLPRPQHLPVPAPSFVEAIAGRAEPTPAPEQLAAAEEMLARLVASGAVIALNLFGAPAGIAGERPDFLATPEALPYLYALQPERNPKRPPITTGASRVSPLASESYQTLEREGALTVAELRQRLGREVTEAATLRALGELWHTLRVAPVPGEAGSPAHWELLSARHRRELNMGSTQSQTTALSILASFYLQSVIAASAGEVEAFLSPLAARSRIRDVLHGLSTTRQLGSFPLHGEGQLYVEGTLPELPEEETAPVPLEAGPELLDAGLEQNEPSVLEATARSRSLPRRPAAPDRPPRKNFGQRFERRAAPGRPAGREERDRRPDRSRSGRDRTDRPLERGGARRPSRPSFGDRARGRGGAPSFDRPRREGGFSRPPSSDRPRPAWKDRRENTQSGESGGGFRKPGGFGKSNARPGPAGRNRFERPQSTRPENTFDTPRRNAAPGKRWERPGASSPARPRFSKDDARKDRSTERSPDRRQARSSDRPPRPFRPRENQGPRSFSDRPPRRDGESRPAFRGGQSRPQGDRPFKRPYVPAGGRPPHRGPAGGYGKSAAGDRPPRKFPPRPRPQGDAPAGGETAPRAFRPAGQRPSRPGGFRKPGAPGKSFAKPRLAGAGRGGPARPGKGRTSTRTSTTTSSGKPRRPGGFNQGRPGTSTGRPPAKGGFKSGGFKPGGKRPGGFAPPRRKPRGESRPDEDI